MRDSSPGSLAHRCSGFAPASFSPRFPAYSAHRYLATVIEASAAQGLKPHIHGLPASFSTFKYRSDKTILPPGRHSLSPAQLLDAEPWRETLEIGTVVDALDTYGKVCQARVIGVLPLNEPNDDTAKGANTADSITGPVELLSILQAAKPADAAADPGAAEGDTPAEGGEEGAGKEATPAPPLDDLGGRVFRVKWTFDAWPEAFDEWAVNVSPRLSQPQVRARSGKASFGMAASDKRHISNVAPPSLPNGKALIDSDDPAWSEGGDPVCMRGVGVGGPLHAGILRAFIQSGAVDAFLQRMHAGSSGDAAAVADMPSPRTVRHMFLSLIHALHALNRGYAHHLAPRLVRAFIAAVGSWADVALREFNHEMFITVGNCLRFQLLRTLPTGEVLAIMEQASLDVAKTLLRGNLLTLRILGMRVVQNACTSVRLNTCQSISAEAMVSLVTEHVLPGLYDPRTAHNDLVRRSVDVLRMLERAEALSTDTLKQLWALKFADGVDSDTRLQVYEVLEGLALDMRPQNIAFVLCEFVAALPRQDTSVADVQLAHRLSSVGQHQPRVGHIGMQVMWRLLDDGSTGVDPTLAPPRTVRALPAARAEAKDPEEEEAEGKASPAAPVSFTPPRDEGKADPGAVVPEKVQEAATEHLALLLKQFSMKPTKMPYAHLACEAVQRGVNATRMLRIVWGIVDSFNVTPIAMDAETKATAVEALNSKVDILQLFFADIAAFKAAAAEAMGGLLKAPAGEDKEALAAREASINATPLPREGGLEFLEALKGRMDFITSITRVSSLSLSEEQAMALWDTFVTGAFTAGETERVMRFILNAAAMSASGLGEVLPQDVEERLFLTKMASPEVELSRFTGPVFSAFRLYFLLINARRGWLSRTPGGADTDFIVHVDPDDMVGNAALWRVALEAQHEVAATAAMTFLMLLYQQLSPTFDTDEHVSSIDFAGQIQLPPGGRPPATEVRSKFIKGCMAELRASLGSLKGDATATRTGADPLAVASRCLGALTRLMRESDEHGDGGLRPHSARLAGARMKLKFSNNVGKAHLPEGAPATFDMSFFSNSSIWQLREAVGAKLGLKPMRVKLLRSGGEIPFADNAKTLRELRISSAGNILVAYKPPSPPKQAPLLMDGNVTYRNRGSAKFSPAAEAAFAEIFNRFCFDGFMTQEQFRMYIVACGVGGSNINKPRIARIFSSCETTPDGYMTQKGFLDFYMEACISRPESVRKDLRKHGYDTRTLQLTDKGKASAMADILAQSKDADESEQGESKVGSDGKSVEVYPAALVKVAKLYDVDLSKDDSRAGADAEERERLLAEAEALEAEAQKNNPRLLLTANVAFFHLLFDALSAPAEVAAPAWDLLQGLPSNTAIVDSFAGIPKGDAAPAWSTLLDSTSTFQFLYGLQVVESLIQSPDIGSVESIDAAEAKAVADVTAQREKAAAARESAAASGGEAQTPEQAAALEAAEAAEDAAMAAKFQSQREEFMKLRAAEDERQAWRKAFLVKGGLQHLHSTLTSYKVPPGEGVEVNLAKEAVGSMLAILRLYFLGAVHGKDAAVDAVVPFGVEDSAQATGDSTPSASGQGKDKGSLSKEQARSASMEPGVKAVINNPDGTFTIVMDDDEDPTGGAAAGPSSDASDAYAMMGLTDDRPSRRPAAGHAGSAAQRRRANAAAAAGASSKSVVADPLATARVANVFVSEFGGDEALSAAVVSAVPVASTVPALLAVLKGAADAGSSADASIVSSGFSLLLALLARDPSALQALLSADGSSDLLPEGVQLPTLLLGLLLCAESRSIRLNTCQGLYRLACNVTSTTPTARKYLQELLLNSLSEVADAVDGAVQPTPGSIAAVVRKDKSGVVPCQQYFALLNYLVRDSTKTATPAEGASESKVETASAEDIAATTERLRPVMRSLVQRVWQHQGVEKRAGSGTAAGAVSGDNQGSKLTDTLLIGLLSLLTTLAESVPAFRMEMACLGEDGEAVPDASSKPDFLHFLFVDCLFFEPTSLADLDETEEAKLPKCKRSVTRGSAFKLLSALCEGTPRVVDRLFSVLEPVLKGVTQVNKYRYKADSDARSSTGYLGIFNLTCLCYMISMLQQLFMIPAFRYGVLAADANVRPALKDGASESKEGGASAEEQEDPRESADESMLWQLQRMFGYLTLSLRRYYDPTPWIKAFKMFGQPIDIKVQQDTEEFLNSMLDQLQERLSGLPQGSLVHDVVTGETTEQFVDTRNGNILRERKEPFHHLSLMVKNLPGVKESLEALTAGENIEDYHLEEEDVRITINKRTRVSRLPAVLFLHCKRFDFSFETFMMEKLNSRFEFPDELDMAPYMREDLQPGKGGAAAGDEEGEGGAADGAGDSQGPEHFKYRLQGIVIHSGTAQGGHYWSYIRDRATGQWNEFNDSRTSTFNPEQIAEKAFGGPRAASATATGYHAASAYDNSSNGYMLVYEKVVPSQGISDAVALAAATAGTKYEPPSIIADPPGYEVLGGEDAKEPLSAEELAVLEGEDKEAAAKVRARQRAVVALQGSKEFSARLRALTAAMEGKGGPIAEGEEVISRQTVVERLLPPGILSDVFADNVRFLRDQDVYSSEFFTFMSAMISRAATTVVQEGDEEAGCRLVNTSLNYALSILSKADNNSTFADVAAVLCEVVSTFPAAAADVLQGFLAAPEPMQEALLKCPSDAVRKGLVGVLGASMQSVYGKEAEGGHAALFAATDAGALTKAEQDRIAAAAEAEGGWQAPWSTMRTSRAVSVRFLALLLDNLEGAYANWPRFEQYFSLLSRAATFGAPMRRVMVANGVVECLVDMLLEKESPEALTAAVRPPKAKRDGVGNPRASPKWGPLLETVSTLVRGISLPAFAREGTGGHKGFIATLRSRLPADFAQAVATSAAPTMLEPETAFAAPLDPATGDSLTLTAEELKEEGLSAKAFGLCLLKIPKFFESALKGLGGSDAVAKLLQHLVWENPDFTATVCATVSSNVNMAMEGAVESYWDIIDGLAGLKDSLQLRRIALLLGDPHHLRHHLAGAGMGLEHLPPPPPKAVEGQEPPPAEPTELQMARVSRMLALSGVNGGALYAIYRRKYSGPRYVLSSIRRLMKLMQSNPMALLYVWRLPPLTRHAPTAARLASPPWANQEQVPVPNPSKSADIAADAMRAPVQLPAVEEPLANFVRPLAEQHQPVAFDRHADWMGEWLLHHLEVSLSGKVVDAKARDALQADLRAWRELRRAGDAVVDAVAAVATGADPAPLCAVPEGGVLCTATVTGQAAASGESAGAAAGEPVDIASLPPSTAWRVPEPTVRALGAVAGSFAPAPRTLPLRLDSDEEMAVVFRRQMGRVVSNSAAQGVSCCAHEFTGEDGKLHLVYRVVSQKRMPLDFELTLSSGSDTDVVNFPLPLDKKKYIYRLHPRDVIFLHEVVKNDPTKSTWGGFRFNWIYNFVTLDGQQVSEVDSDYDTDTEGRLGLRSAAGDAGGHARPEVADGDSRKRTRVDPNADLRIDVEDVGSDGALSDHERTPLAEEVPRFRSDSELARMLAAGDFDGIGDISFDTEDMIGPRRQ